MNKLTILTILSLTIFSCTTKTGKIETKKKIIITADSCKNWGLPPINFEVEYPDDFTSEINPTGGFYLQLRKLNGDTILQEISFGQVDGEMNDEKLKRNLTYIDSVLNSALTNAGQGYKTDFLGSDFFNETKTIQIRSTIDFKNLPRDSFITNGQYKSLMTCVYSPTSPDQAIMISVISSTKENIDNKTTLGTTTSEILKSFKVR
jgi:hypothetical protein